MSAPVTISVVANQGPTVSLTSPTNGQTFIDPAAITLTASAVDNDGTIARVEFYWGAVLLGQATAAPFSVTWNNVAAGSYSFTAKAFDNSNASATSGAVSVTVNEQAVAPGVYYIESDHLNSPRVIKDQNHNVVWKWDSDPFGEAAANKDPDGDRIRFDYALRFPGRYYDKETGLNYNYFRSYDPQTGRYVQSDPIGLAGGINTYGYVQGDPVNSIDPDGLRGIPSTWPTPYTPPRYDRLPSSLRKNDPNGWLRQDYRKHYEDPSEWPVLPNPTPFCRVECDDDNNQCSRNWGQGIPSIPPIGGQKCRRICMPGPAVTNQK